MSTLQCTIAWCTKYITVHYCTMQGVNCSSLLHYSSGTLQYTALLHYSGGTLQCIIALCSGNIAVHYCIMQRIHCSALLHYAADTLQCTITLSADTSQCTIVLCSGSIAVHYAAGTIQCSGSAVKLQKPPTWGLLYLTAVRHCTTLYSVLCATLLFFKLMPACSALNALQCTAMKVETQFSKQHRSAGFPACCTALHTIERPTAECTLKGMLYNDLWACGWLCSLSVPQVCWASFMDGFQEVTSRQNNRNLFSFCKIYIVTSYSVAGCCSYWMPGNSALPDMLLCTWLTIQQYTELPCRAQHSITLHYTELHSRAQHRTLLHCNALHSTVLPCTALNCTAQYYAALYCTVLPCTAL